MEFRTKGSVRNTNLGVNQYILNLMPDSPGRRYRHRIKPKSEIGVGACLGLWKRRSQQIRPRSQHGGSWKTSEEAKFQVKLQEGGSICLSNDLRGAVTMRTEN